MAYIGRNPAIGTQKVLDSLESQFNGVLTTFDLRYNTNTIYPTIASALIVSLGGVLQEPGSAYNVASDQITFATAPPTGADCWILLYSEFGGVAGATTNLTVGNNLAVQGNTDLDGDIDIDAGQITYTASSNIAKFADDAKLIFGEGDDLQIYHTADTESVIHDNGTGPLKIRTNNLQIKNSADGTTLAEFLSGTNGVSLYYNNSKKLETTSTGATITGTALATDLSTGASGTGINISTDTISGPATLTLDPAGVGDNTGTVIIAGGLQVDGTTTTINSTTLTVDDKNIVLASGATNAAAADGAGITVDGAAATLLYNATPDAWSFNKNVGIGTDSPTSKLEVSGGDLYVNSLDGNEVDIKLGIHATHSNFSVIKSVRASNSQNFLSFNIHNGSLYEALQIHYDEGLYVRGNGNYNTSAYTGNVSHVLFGDQEEQFADIVVESESASSRLGSFIFKTKGTVGVLPQERLRITSGGNVGIGTNNPQQLLDIASAAPSIRFTDTVDGYSEIDGNSAELKFNADKGNAKADSKITFFVDNTEKVRITSGFGGNLLVGMETVYNVNATAHFRNGINIVAEDENGDVTQVSLAGEPVGRILFGDTRPGKYAEINCIADGVCGTNDYPGRLVFRTTPDGSGNTVERMRIDSDGHVTPGADAAQDLGSTSKRWANIYSADLQLSNEGSSNEVDGTWGAYTIQEGEEELFLINRRSGKKFKFVLEEVK